MGNSIVVQKIYLIVRYNVPRERRMQTLFKLRYTSLVFFMFYNCSKYMDMTGPDCTDCCTVNPDNDKMSVDHSHNSQVILIPSQVYAPSLILIRDIVLTSVTKVSFTRTWPHGQVSYALTPAYIHAH